MSGFHSHPSQRYDGPEFEEYCIAEGGYLPATRDRTPCVTCPLGTLCQAGFEEQIRRVAAGQNPSLTECKVFDPADLVPETLLSGLTDEQARFVREKVFHDSEGE